MFHVCLVFELLQLTDMNVDAGVVSEELSWGTLITAAGVGAGDTLVTTLGRSLHRSLSHIASVSTTV